MKCIYCSKNLTSETRQEHVLQDAIGGRWKSPRIVCNDCQDFFSKTIDGQLADQMMPFKFMINAKSGLSGRSINRSIQVFDEKGGFVWLKAGCVVDDTKPSVEVLGRNAAGEVDFVNVTVRDMAQKGHADAVAKSLVGENRIRMEVPAKQLPAELHQRAEDRVFMMPFRFEQPYLARALAKACFNLIGVVCQEIPFCEGFVRLKQFVLEKGLGSLPYWEFFKYLVAEPELRLPAIGAFDHFICAYSGVGTCDAFVRLWGEVPFLLRLSSSYDGPDFKCSYLVSPVAAGDGVGVRQVKNPDFDPAALPCFEVGDFDAGNLYLQAARRFTEKSGL